MILRTIKCGICKKEVKETKPNEGWKGWGQLTGGDLNDGGEPHLCPDCKSKMFNYADLLSKNI